MCLLIFVHFHSKFGKKCSVEFFSPAIANNQTSKIFTLIGNCINKRNKTTLIFVCYQDEMVEQCLSISFIQQQSPAYHLPAPPERAPPEARGFSWLRLSAILSQIRFCRDHAFLWSCIDVILTNWVLLRLGTDICAKFGQLKPLQ